MAPSFVSPLSRSLHFVREHPFIVSCLLLLPLSPSIYRVILYFTPLFLSTALCIFALITVTPYVTATDAEVERQSTLGGTSHFKTTNTMLGTRQVCGTVERLSCDVSTSAAPLSPSTPENSWLSWMKGLNDIGRTWMESQLKEQGLALSEPANRETLLSLIEGSFAELVTVKDQSVELFTSMNNILEVEVESHSNSDVLERVSKCDNDTARQVEGMLQGFTTERDNEGDAFLGSNAEVIADNVGVADEGSRKPLPVSAMPEHTPPIEVAADAFVFKQERVDRMPATEVNPCLPELDAVDIGVQKHETTPIFSKFCHMPEREAASLMPKTPSRTLSSPSEHIGASRRIFSKEESIQTATVLRSPFQALTMSKKQPLKPSAGTTSSKNESAPLAFKLPTRKFLDRSRSITGKDGGKLASPLVTECTVGKTDQEGSDAGIKMKTAEDHFDVQSSIVENVVYSSNGNVEGGNIAVSDDQGPKFDEGLEIEEVQALVRSELMMLDMEIDELAARLPKLDKSIDYEKTPVRRPKVAAATSTPTTPAASIRSTTSLFASPIFK